MIERSAIRVKKDRQETTTTLRLEYIEIVDEAFKKTHISHIATGTRVTNRPEHAPRAKRIAGRGQGARWSAVLRAARG